MKKFKVDKIDFDKNSSFFCESEPPSWLLGGRKGSTMDNRWFYEGHVLKLAIGCSVRTDFSIITRIE